VDAFEVLTFTPPTFDFRVTCSGGTYVRVLVADVGSALGCGAHLGRLRRTAIGPFSVAGATPPAEPGDPLPVERAVGHLPRVDLEEPEEARAAANGSILARRTTDRRLAGRGIEGPSRDGARAGMSGSPLACEDAAQRDGTGGRREDGA
jgi:tRNA U55 pseudouridine synthase TruB